MELKRAFVSDSMQAGSAGKNGVCRPIARSHFTFRVCRERAMLFSSDSGLFNFGNSVTQVNLQVGQGGFGTMMKLI